MRLTVWIAAGGALVILMTLGATGRPTASAQSGPVFDPDRTSCSPYPQPTLARSWQVSAPRGWPGPVFTGESVQVGLRNKFGSATESYAVTATIFAPDGSVGQATQLLGAADWAYLQYPDDFDAGSTLSGGTYTVIWTIDGGFVACDGFVLQVAASPQAQSVASFYRELNGGDLPGAYAWLSPAFQASQPYASWKAGYATTIGVDAEAQLTPDPTVIAVTLASDDFLPGTGEVRHHFSGTWHLTYNAGSGRWLLDAASISLLD